MKKIPAILMLTVIVALIIAAFGAIRHFAFVPQQEYQQGQIDARRVMVAGKLAGRISKFSVHEGDSVTAGDIIAEIYSPKWKPKNYRRKAHTKRPKRKRPKRKTVPAANKSMPPKP
ncbi:biotin/lipoyl-binding protein [Fibrobacter sp. UWS1]|uniref:biotin/lipoyl-binding protein n=1 Tax=Fibrobacter sp. UWS1 TaxID=1896220 RepID=UPI001E4C709D|nr:biotin/lipoyl-binding protein [Fibrobacter sp. UWS1]